MNQDSGIKKKRNEISQILLSPDKYLNIHKQSVKFFDYEMYNIKNLHSKHSKFTIFPTNFQILLIHCTLSENKL